MLLHSNKFYVATRVIHTSLKREAVGFSADSKSEVNSSAKQLKVTK